MRTAKHSFPPRVVFVFIEEGHIRVVISAGVYENEYLNTSHINVLRYSWSVVAFDKLFDFTQVNVDVVAKSLRYAEIRVTSTIRNLLKIYSFPFHWFHCDSSAPFQFVPFRFFSA